MLNKFIAAAVFSVSTLAVVAPSTLAEARTHRVLVCDKQHSHGHNNRGTLIGAVGGGLLGHTIAGHGSKTGGTLIGAGVGAVAGHQIAKNSGRGHCHYVYR